MFNLTLLSGEISQYEFKKNNYQTYNLIEKKLIFQIMHKGQVKGTSVTVLNYSFPGNTSNFEITYMEIYFWMLR
jgi:hypothetical protein